MTHLHPRGVNHLALATTDMKGQLEFWCDVLGLPLKALYWMHGAKGAYHGFVELAPDSYVAFVQMPENTKDMEYGTSHANGPGGAIRGRARCNTLRSTSTRVDDVLGDARSAPLVSVKVLGPIDHGFIQSIYFDGPEGLNLEICCGTDRRRSVDRSGGRRVVRHHRRGAPSVEGAVRFERPRTRSRSRPVPTRAVSADDEHPAWYSRVIGLPDEVWERMSEPDVRPVRTED